MKPTIDKPVYRLIADAMLMDGQWEMIPAPVYKGLFRTKEEDMEDTILDLIENITNEPSKRRQ
jgi:hypothetical protein